MTKLQNIHWTKWTV